MTSSAGREFLALPNLVSIARILATPVLIYLLSAEPTRKGGLIAAVVFLVVCFTDWLDGFLARRMRLVTTLGKFIDPLADKILIVSALIMLIQMDRAPAWIVALIVARELAVTGLRAVAVSGARVVIQASILGKLKTVTQIVSITCLILHYDYMGVSFQYVGTIVLWLALFITMYSGADYFYKFYSSTGD